MPRANFNGTLPEELKDYHLTYKELVEHFDVRGPEEEYDSVFILDNRVKKVSVDLGPMVGKITFVARSGRRFANGPANRLSPLPRKK